MNRLRYRGPRHLDRTLALELGEVESTLEFDVQHTIDGGAETLLAGECDLAEVPLGFLIACVARGDDSIQGIPVFLSRRFPHRFLWVESESPLGAPIDLDGRKVGWAPGSGAAASWARHLIVSSGANPEFVQGTMGGSMAAVLDLGREQDGKHLPAAVVDGEIDALATPYPVPSGEGGERLRPLIADRGAAEREWVDSGGPLGMSTVVAVRSEILESGLSAVLLEAFEASKRAGASRMRYPGAPAVALPWLVDDLIELDSLFGGDAYPYGIEENRETLEAVLVQVADLGISPRRVEPDELFA